MNHLNIVMALEGEYGVSLEIDDVTRNEQRGDDTRDPRQVWSRSLMCSPIRRLPGRATPRAARVLRPDVPPRLHSGGQRRLLSLAVRRHACQQARTLPLCKLCASLDGEIIGCLGYIPLEITLGGACERVGVARQLDGGPQPRQFGLGPLLVRDIANDFDFTLAAGRTRTPTACLSAWAGPTSGNSRAMWPCSTPKPRAN